MVKSNFSLLELNKDIYCLFVCLFVYGQKPFPEEKQLFPWTLHLVFPWIGAYVVMDVG